MKDKAAFFDRDGTLIEDVNYLDSFDKIKIISKSIQLCSFLQNKGYKLFVITNQSGIARGFFDINFVIQTHIYLKKLFREKNIYIEQFYFCPHHYEFTVNNKFLKKCECRKPKPGLLLRAANDFNLDLKRSLMFGDKKIDFQAGLNAGCRSFYIQSFLNNTLSFKDILKGDSYGE